MTTTINAKLYDGKTPCCNGNQPLHMMEQSGWYVDSLGNRVRMMTNAEVVGYSGNVNVETPAGLDIEYLPTGPLMCPECAGDQWDDMWADGAANFGDTFQAMEPILRGISMAVSYIPVFGTIASYIISTALNLADGKRLDDAMLDAVGEALPGQPASGMAFSAVRAVVSGDGIDAVAIQAMPDPPATPQIKKVLYVGSQLLINIAKGENVSDAALDQISAQLPKAGQDAMSAARNLVNGMPVSDVTVKALGRQAADAMQTAAAAAARAGKVSANQFVSEAGLQAALDSLPPDIQLGVKAAWTVELAKKQQDALESAGFAAQETNKSTNDAYVKKGQAVIAGKASIGKVYLGTIRNGRTYLGTTITPLWQRGFDIAVGLCEGLAADSLEQQKVRASLTLLQTQTGFDTGQAIQFQRTAQRRLALISLGPAVPTSQSILSKLTLSTPTKTGNPMMALGRIQVQAGGNAAAPQTLIAANRAYAANGAALAASSPVIQAARSLLADGKYRYGFDIGTAIARGNSIDGPGQKAVRDSLGPTYSNTGPDGGQGSTAAIQGFYAGQHLQFGLTMAAKDNAVAAAASGVPATQAAGALMTAGTIGQGTTAVNSTVGLVASNAVAKAGAATVVSAKQGFFAKLLAFFGL